MTSRRALTYAELLVVCLVIATLCAAALPVYWGRRDVRPEQLRKETNRAAAWIDSKLLQAKQSRRPFEFRGSSVMNPQFSIYWIDTREHETFSSDDALFRFDLATSASPLYSPWGHTLTPALTIAAYPARGPKTYTCRLAISAYCQVRVVY